MRPRVAFALLVLLATSLHAGSSITATTAALATANRYATGAGLAVLKSGGNAVDAAIAVAFVLAVVDPQAGNIAGGGFLVYYDAKTKGVWALDFRETAPAASKADMFALADGKVSPEIRTGPRSAGVPASVAGLAAAHKRFGSRPWKELLAPAIALASGGFLVDEQLAKALADQKSERNIDQFASTSAIFYPGGKALTAGTKLVQKDLAATLERIANEGADAFYRGDIATRAVDAIRKAGGVISDRDLRDYKPLWRSPLKIEFGDYALFTVPPPSSGGMVLAESLNIVSGFDLATARIPYRNLLSPARAAQWRPSIKPNRALMTLPPPGPTPIPYPRLFS